MLAYACVDEESSKGPDGHAALGAVRALGRGGRTAAAMRARKALTRANASVSFRHVQALSAAS